MYTNTHTVVHTVVAYIICKRSVRLSSRCRVCRAQIIHSIPAGPFRGAPGDRDQPACLTRPPARRKATKTEHKHENAHSVVWRSPSICVVGSAAPQSHRCHLRTPAPYFSVCVCVFDELLTLFRRLSRLCCLRHRRLVTSRQ